MITRRALFLLLLAAPIVALATIDRAALWGAALYVLGVLVLMAVDVVLSPKPGDFRLSRENEAKLSLGADNTIRIVLRRVGSAHGSGLRTKAVPFIVRDEPPSEYVLSRLFMQGTMSPGEQLDLTYT